VIELVLATRNQGKFKELTSLIALRQPGIILHSLNGFKYIDVEEDYTTFHENAYKKATTILKQIKLPCLADDSGLEVDALFGKPGVQSARFAGPKVNDLENRTKLLDELKPVPLEKRTARFRCALVLSFPDGKNFSAEGVLEGQILTEPRGCQGFGYDSLFFVPSLGKTLAEILQEEKNQLSHRAKAFEELFRKLHVSLKI